MIYIKKMKPLSEASKELQRVYKDFDWEHIDKSNVELVRSIFDSLEKGKIRESLVREQKGLCAYCMRRIYNDYHTTIEHYKSIESHGEMALAYSNMMACCDGGRNNQIVEDFRVLSCDAAKGKNSISINPYNQKHMAMIRYGMDGKIYTWPKQKEFERDINKTLKLNGNVDDDGKIINDSSTSLVYNRQAVYDNYVVFIKGLSRRGKNIRVAVKKRIEEIQNAEQMEEYAGVWLFFLKRKLGEVSC